MIDNIASDIGEDWNLSWLLKGFPPAIEALPSSRVAEQGWTLEADFTTPIAALDDEAIGHNLRLMNDYCRRSGLQIAPHGKTSMSPELIGRQLRAGAWGMTAASVAQARIMIAAGAKRVIIANECADDVSLQLIAALNAAHNDCEIHVFVDSAEGIAALALAVGEAWTLNSTAQRPLSVILDVGFVGGRGGVRSEAEAERLQLIVRDSPELVLVGVGGFEGILGADRSAETLSHVRRYLCSIRDLAVNLERAGAFASGRPVILTAGGSAYFDLVAEVFADAESQMGQFVDVVIRSGCYIAHDHGVYESCSPLAGRFAGEFRAALTVWSSVLSTPEPGLALLDAGKRDISTEGEVRVLQILRDGEAVSKDSCKVERFNDQHGYLRFDADSMSVRVGDRVQLGSSHPCLTFDKWRAVPVIGRDSTVVSVVRTFF